MWALFEAPTVRRSLQSITTIGLDIAKSVFQARGVDAASQVVIRRQLKRRYVLALFQKLSPCVSTTPFTMMRVGASAARADQLTTQSSNLRR